VKRIIIPVILLFLTHIFMMCWFPEMIWINFSPILYLILSKKLIGTKGILSLAVLSFIAPALATFWIASFSYMVYMIAIIGFFLIFFGFYFLILIAVKKFDVWYQMVFFVIIIYSVLYYILYIFNFNFIIEFSAFTNLYGLTSVLGSYYVSTLTILLNSLFALGFIYFKRIKQILYFTTLLLILFILYFSNSIYTTGDSANNKSIDVVIVQGNFNQTWKWRVDNISQVFETYKSLTLEATKSLTTKYRLIVWPEYAIVGDMFNKKQQYLHKIKSLAKQTSAYIVLGTIIRANKKNYYDTALIFSPEGEISGQYNSLYPTYFNESTEPGDEFITFEIADKKFGLVICYEEILPLMFEEYKRRKVTHIISLVNNMMFDHTPGMDYLLRNIRLRASEYGIPIIRSANTGYSGIIGVTGQMFFEVPIFKRSYIIGKI